MSYMNQVDIDNFEREIEVARRDKAKADAERARHEAEKARAEAIHEKEKTAKTKAETEKTQWSNLFEGIKAAVALATLTLTAFGVWQKYKQD